MRKPKVLIVYASYGDGHYQVSKAIESSFHEQGITDVVLLDLMAEAHPLLNGLTKFVYMQSFKTIPYLYGWVYNTTRRMQPNRPLYGLLHSIGLNKLAKIVAGINPDMVIHTFPQLTMPKLLRRTGQTIPIINVITDFDIHARWFHPAVNRYYVATQDLKNEMVSRGIPEERVVASGIPLRPGFSGLFEPQDGEGDEAGVDMGDRRDMGVNAKADADVDGNVDRDANLNPNSNTSVNIDGDPIAAARSARQLAARIRRDGKPVILLMAGAYGVMPNITDICRRLTADGERRVIAVCGKNKELFTQLQQRFANHEDVQVYGFVNDIASLMAVSDCIITKPGGITLSEALVSRLPMFLFRPVPGQELNNALYLKKKGIAFISHRPSDLVRQIEQFFSRRPEGDLYRELESLRRPDAARAIVEDVIRQFIAPDKIAVTTAAAPS
ncbi:MGDG synthase family glycosyltransferase [Paenibacillus physcomitrellae]|uniref:Processive diacylglycerol beta-glucosyltransferase n=1 Tax=Paenibacillus physcomitrellae TaxID=1619311 RepID=A0ABQ1FWK8_9BACL|nr:glycosyltransferase [Paenibacillus physcomitrellae]GGA31886.1 processive diacylglycerol beta-glucosyltransferase [Paenibacillus physcomitrellae]